MDTTSVVVVFYSDQEVYRTRIDISRIMSYINIVKFIGFNDDNGDAYKFKSATVECDQIVIYLNEE